MKRDLVDSSNLHSVGCDDTGLEVQFHRAGCAHMTKPVEGHQAGCNCIGGDVWHYSGVPAEVHSMILNAPSPGAIFHKLVKSAKNPEGGALHPGVKREPKAAS